MNLPELPFSQKEIREQYQKQVDISPLKLYIKKVKILNRWHGVYNGIIIKCPNHPDWS